MIIMESEANYAARMAPQKSLPPPPPPPPPPPKTVLDWQDERLLERLRDAEECPTWSLINSFVADHSPRDRKTIKDLSLEMLSRLKRLRDLGLVFPLGRNWISATKPDPTKRRPKIRRRRASVAKESKGGAVSAVTPSNPQVVPDLPHQVRTKLANTNPASGSPAVGAVKTESVPTAEPVAAAARQLARLPRNQPREYTGWLHGQHCWRGRLLILPDNTVVPLFWCNRGRVLTNCAGFELPDDSDLARFNFMRRWALHEADVKLYKHPAAVTLGSLKRGVRERPSAAKSNSARANGCQPCRPGKRRGRPRRDAAVRPTPATA